MLAADATVGKAQIVDIQEDRIVCQVPNYGARKAASKSPSTRGRGTGVSPVVVTRASRPPPFPIRDATVRERSRLPVTFIPLNSPYYPIPRVLPACSHR